VKLELQLSIDTTSLRTVALFSLWSAVGSTRSLFLPLFPRVNGATGEKTSVHTREEREPASAKAKLDSRAAHKTRYNREHSTHTLAPTALQLVQSRPDIVVLRPTRERERERERERGRERRPVAASAEVAVG